MNVQIKLLHPDAEPPAYETFSAAGMDLRAMIDKPMWLQAGQVALIPTGLAIWLEDPTLAAFILPRSGLGHKKGLVLGNLTGTIDADYQKEIFISAWNRSEEALEIQPRERIAQLVVQPIVRIVPTVVSEFSASNDRGGFGSTGAH